MSNNLSPQYLVDLIPEPIQNRYTLRDNNNVPLIHCRSQLYKDSFLPSVIRDWNSLPNSTKASQSLYCFRQNLRSNYLKPRSYYSIGSRMGQLLHTRLRLNCSSLNHDLFRKSIIENSLCSCGEIETTSHFLLVCRNYSIIRQQYMSNLPCILTYQNLIYGNEHLSDDENAYVFIKVQEFIIASKRFAA